MISVQLGVSLEEAFVRLRAHAFAAGTPLHDVAGDVISRVIIEQAKGVLAERLRVTPDEAFVILRRYARDHNHPLTELSGDVIRGTARIATER
jgi:AmiR/NasT family two-component response regulator